MKTLFIELLFNSIIHEILWNLRQIDEKTRLHSDLQSFFISFYLSYSPASSLSRTASLKFLAISFSRRFHRLATTAVVFFLFSVCFFCLFLTSQIHEKKTRQLQQRGKKIKRRREKHQHAMQCKK